MLQRLIDVHGEGPLGGSYTELSCTLERKGRGGGGGGTITKNTELVTRLLPNSQLELLAGGVTAKRVSRRAVEVAVGLIVGLIDAY